MEAIMTTVPSIYQHPRVQAAIAKDLEKKLRSIKAIPLTLRARSFLEESLKISQIQKRPGYDFNTFGEATLIMVALKVTTKKEMEEMIAKHAKPYETATIEERKRDYP